MAQANQTQALEPRRVREFANFFKRYMSISSVIAAALPIPVTAVGLIPTFSAQTSYLSTYTSMFCFLCLGFVFYSRHQLAPRMFPEFLERFGREGTAPSYAVRRSTVVRVFEFVRGAFRTFGYLVGRMFIPILPFLLILAALYCVLEYHGTLRESVMILHTGSATVEEILKNTSMDEIPFSTSLELYYMGIFITAESAFILMAMKEYLQDLVGLTDFTILTGSVLPEGVSPSELIVGVAGTKMEGTPADSPPPPDP